MKPGRMVIGVALFAPVSAIAGVTDSLGNPHPTLQEAVTASAAGGTLVVDPGTVTDLTTVLIDRNLTIEGAGAGVSILKATGGASILDLSPGVVLTLRDLSLVGNTSNTQRGIFAAIDTNTLTLTDVTIDTAHTGAGQHGGGLYVRDWSALSLTRVTFLGNGGASLATQGGAIYLSNASGTAPADLVDVVFEDSGASTSGGAIYAVGTDLTCDGCVFDTAVAGNGGAIYAASGTVTVTRSRFCGNAATTSGGAIYGNATGTITDSIFAGGTGFAGGALYANSGTWTVTNNHFLANGGGGAVQTDFAGAAVISAINNLFLENTGFGIALGVSSSPTVAYNWFQGNLGSVSNYSIALPGSNEVNAGDPDLVGWPGTCMEAALYPTPIDSPLIDAGDPTLFDLDGTRSDIGAFGGPGADPDSPVADDTDADGVYFLHDCDDADGANFPGNDESCDGQDNNCDGLSDDADPAVTDQQYWHPDCDGDGQGATAITEVACFEPVDACGWLSEDVLGAYAGIDCDDTESAVFYGAPEYCDDGDQNCDGDPDAGAVDGATYYDDIDGDGYGDDYTAQTYCVVSPPDTSALPGDCDDNNDLFHPGASDPCGDGDDQDCGGADGDPTNSDPFYVDSDLDGWGDPDTDPVYSCEDPGTGYSDATNAQDCDDGDDQVNPAAAEQCNLVDDDCNGLTDDMGAIVSWYFDADRDGYGDDVFTVEDECPPVEEGWILIGGDCDDSDELVNPGMDEVCNGVDDDCDDARDHEDPSVVDAEQMWLDFDKDTYGACDPLDPECRPKAVCLGYTDDTWADNAEDCDDANPAVNPGKDEVPDNDLDDNCDGAIDRDGDGSYEGSGCNCSAAPAAPGAWWLAGLLPLLAFRRRT